MQICGQPFGGLIKGESRGHRLSDSLLRIVMAGPDSSYCGNLDRYSCPEGDPVSTQISSQVTSRGSKPKLPNITPCWDCPRAQTIQPPLPREPNRRIGTSDHYTPIPGHTEGRSERHHHPDMDTTAPRDSIRQLGDRPEDRPHESPLRCHPRSQTKGTSGHSERSIDPLTSVRSTRSDSGDYTRRMEPEYHGTRIHTCR